jgi:integrase
VSVHEITYGALEDWADELHDSGLNPSTVQAILSTMRSMMKWMRKRQELSDVPDFPTVSIPEHEPVLLTLEQQTAVLEAIPAGIRGIFLAMADLWLRPSEARALAPSDYDPVKDRGPDDPAGWTVIRRAADGEGSSSPVREWTKTKRVRRLPVSDRLAEWIAEHRSSEARLRNRFLFPSPYGDQKGMWSKSGLQTAWQRACKRAGVPVVKLNEGNRHTSATAARQTLGEAQLTTVQKMLGHSDLRNTERYSRHKSGDLVKLVRKK